MSNPTSENRTSSATRNFSANGVWWPNRTSSRVRPPQTHRCGSPKRRPEDPEWNQNIPELYRMKRRRAQKETCHRSYGNKLSSGHRYGYRGDKEDPVHESNRQCKATPCGRTKIPRICRELGPQSSCTSLPTRNIESASQRRQKIGRLLFFLHRKPHRSRSRVVRWPGRKLNR